MANFSQVDEQVDAIDVGVLQFENLYPVLLQTFVVIVLGYVALHRFKIEIPRFSFIDALALYVYWIERRNILFFSGT